MSQRYVLYCKGRLPTDDYSRMYVPIFTEAHKARTFLEEFMAGDDHSRVGDTIHLPRGFTVKSEQLDLILGAKLEDWVLPSLDERRILRFKYGSWDGMSVKVPDAVVDRAPKVERERRPERPSGFVTISDLAASWGVPAMIARAALRASGREKPSYGWSFDPKEIPAIKEIVGIK